MLNQIASISKNSDKLERIVSAINLLDETNWTNKIPEIIFCLIEEGFNQVQISPDIDLNGTLSRVLLYSVYQCPQESKRFPH